jgi:hypothetical protein
MTSGDASTLDSLAQTPLHWWGKLFRFLFIAILGLAGWAVFDRPGIEDVHSLVLQLS